MEFRKGKQFSISLLQNMNVVIAGSGNVANVLGRKILTGGDNIIQVAGRNKEVTEELANILNAEPITDFARISEKADLYIITVTDTAINEIATQLHFENAVIVHTAAAVSKVVLKNSSFNYGVLYPLQSLRKELTTIPPIPIYIDGNNNYTLEFLHEFAKKWAISVAVANDEKRLQLHLAAVLAGNFTNHLLAITEKFCKEKELEFKLLYPLIEETIRRVENNSPAAVQTGPAIRNNWETMQKHEEILYTNKSLKDLYTFLSKSIIEFYKLK